MTLTQARQMINASPLDATMKQRLLDQLGTDETLTQNSVNQLIQSMTNAAETLTNQAATTQTQLRQAETELGKIPDDHQAYQELKKDLNSIDGQARQQVDQAYQDYQASLQEINTELTDVYTAANQLLDQEEMEKLKESI